LLGHRRCGRVPGSGGELPPTPPQHMGRLKSVLDLSQRNQAGDICFF
jgi:hypothetical protein